MIKVKTYVRQPTTREFHEAVRNAKILVSTFGLGEGVGKDYETILSGAVLVKPYSVRLRSSPDVYTEGYSVSCRADFSDLEQVIMTILGELSPPFLTHLLYPLPLHPSPPPLPPPPWLPCSRFHWSLLTHLNLSPISASLPFPRPLATSAGPCGHGLRKARQGLRRGGDHAHHRIRPQGERRMRPLSLHSTLLPDSLREQRVCCFLCHSVRSVSSRVLNDLLRMPLLAGCSGVPCSQAGARGLRLQIRVAGQPHQREPPEAVG